jgi:hypothetical protein
MYKCPAAVNCAAPETSDVRELARGEPFGKTPRVTRAISGASAFVADDEATC